MSQVLKFKDSAETQKWKYYENKIYFLGATICPNRGVFSTPSNIYDGIFFEKTFIG